MRPVRRVPVRAVALAAALVSAGALVAAGGSAASAASADPVLLHQGLVTRQDVAPQPGSEADTVVEPDVQASPLNSNNVISAAHDGRYPDGGAVSISVAWSHDGGATWHHSAVPNVTKANGGPWDRASDPVVAWGPDGTAYLSILAISLGCPSAVVVLRSTDAGQSWSAPVNAHYSGVCSISDDKNWLTVDNSPQSPHYGRVYQFWTPFFYPNGQYQGAAQAVRWSDDKGLTWSATSYLTARDHGTQGSQPMVLANGDVVDTFYDYGRGNEVPDVGPYGPDNPRNLRLASGGGIDPTGTVYAVRSADGGQTWTAPVEVINNAGGYATGVRCCLMSATVDASTQTMYVAYEGYGQGNTDPVLLVSSRDGVRWTSPVAVSHGDVRGVQRVNVDVSAARGHVYVAFGTRTDAADHGGYVQQQLATSADRGRSFGSPVSLGPVSVLRYAAYARGYFPGDYIGTSISGSRLYLVWAVSSKPPVTSSSRYHQVIYGASLRIP